MQNSWLVLVPPFIVLICAFITRHLNLSLIIGIFSGALIATDFSVWQAIVTSGQRFYQTISTVDNLLMYSFLLMIGTLVVLLNKTGGASAFAHTVTAKLRSSRMAQHSSVLLSCSLFIDDYLSGLTVGYVMRPITDKFHIPRAKLAFLVHSMMGPLVILAPISSWVATITSTLDQAGIGPAGTLNAKLIGDPFFIYLETIPYIFYSFLMIASVWFIIRQNISYGPMHKHDEIAQKTGNLFGGKEPLPGTFETVHEGCITDLLVPLSTLIASVFLGSLWAGNYHLFGGSRTMLDALKHNTNIFLVLFVSGIVTLTMSFFYALIRKKIAMRSVPCIIQNGIHLMANAIMMVMLASTLGKIIQVDLATGQYLAGILQGSISFYLLPLIFFIIAAITATLTGSSWGTMILLIPIAIPMLITFAQAALPAAPESICMLFPVLGAIFSGAVCGDHLSPISETTIMAATSSGAYPLDHAQTQFPYAIPAIISSAVGFILVGMLAPCRPSIKVFVPLAISMILCLGLLLLFNVIWKRRKKNGTTH